MTLTATEVLGAYQLGLITHPEAREQLGFPAQAPTDKVGEEE